MGKLICDALYTVTIDLRDMLLLRQRGGTGWNQFAQYREVVGVVGIDGESKINSKGAKRAAARNIPYGSPLGILKVFLLRRFLCVGDIYKVRVRHAPVQFTGLF